MWKISLIVILYTLDKIEKNPLNIRSKRDFLLRKMTPGMAWDTREQILGMGLWIRKEKKHLLQ